MGRRTSNRTASRSRNIARLRTVAAIRRSTGDVHTAKVRGKRVAVLADPTASSAKRLMVSRPGLGIITTVVRASIQKASRGQAIRTAEASKRRGRRTALAAGAQYQEPKAKTRTRQRRRAIVATRGRGKTGAHRFTSALHPRGANGRSARK